MATPSRYTTLPGLLRATEKVLKASLAGQTRFDGQSLGMRLANARFIAREKFGSDQPIRALQERYAITRAQDLLGGNTVFGYPLPVRDYVEGDNIPGLGRVRATAGRRQRVPQAVLRADRVRRQRLIADRLSPAAIIRGSQGEAR
ncbi:hypothetical protein [Azotobacter armeniacus]